MREYKKQRGRQEVLAFFVLKCAGVVLLLVVTVFLMHAAWGMYGKMAAASQSQEEAENQLASLEAQQQGVSNTLGKISTERGEEAQIRERFGVVRPGEGEIDIIRDQKAATSSTAGQESWLKKLFNAFKVW